MQITRPILLPKAELGIGWLDLYKIFIRFHFSLFYPYSFQVTFVLSEQHYGRTNQLRKRACKLFED